MTIEYRLSLRVIPMSFRLPDLKIGTKNESFHFLGKVPVESDKLKM
jgi:hypothetical protein